MKGRNGQTILANMFSVTLFTIVKLRKKTQKSDVSPMIKEAFQGFLATGDIAKKCGDNSFLIHRQPTKTDRKGRQFATVTIHFYFQQSDLYSLCFFRKRSLCHGSCGTGCDVVTRQHDSFVTTRQQTITGHYKVNKPFNCCHAVGLLFPAAMSSYKGRLGCWRVTVLSVFLRQM